MQQTLKTTPAMAATVALMVAFVAAVQFSVPAWQNYGIGSLYLWPVTLVALWFGARVAVGVVAVVMLLQVAWFAAVPHDISAGVGATSIALRSVTYVFVAVVVGEFAHRLRGVAFTDPLTKLPNRRAFFEEVERRSAPPALLESSPATLTGSNGSTTPRDMQPVTTPSSRSDAPWRSCWERPDSCAGSAATSSSP